MILSGDAPNITGNTTQIAYIMLFIKKQNIRNNMFYMEEMTPKCRILLLL